MSAADVGTQEDPATDALDGIRFSFEASLFLRGDGLMVSEVMMFDAVAAGLAERDALRATLARLLAWEPHVTLRDELGREGRLLARAADVESARALVGRC